jgi:hypothetical protein
MMLAPTMAGNSPRLAVAPRIRRPGIVLDAVLLSLAVAACLAFIFQGGLEVLLGAVTGVVISARGERGLRASAMSGAFAGLFIGLMFAGFFHDPIAAFIRALI